jgi:hypothetical protein
LAADCPPIVDVVLCLLRPRNIASEGIAVEVQSAAVAQVRDSLETLLFPDALVRELTGLGQLELTLEMGLMEQLVAAALALVEHSSSHSNE